MTRNLPTNFPSDQEFKTKWLSEWTEDLGDSIKVEGICKKYTDQVKSISAADRHRLLIDVIKFIDLTTLSGDDTKQRVIALIDKAVKPFPENSNLHCAAVCFYPARLADVKEYVAANEDREKIGIAVTAGGFPSGQYRLESRLLEVQLAVADGATEIDIVINRAAALDDDWALLHREISLMRLACGDKAHLKTILSTGELGTLKRIYQASIVAILAGSDLIKTSTGKEAVNATLPVSYVMCKAIAYYYKLTGIKIGFKPAGGIRTADEALSYIFLVSDVLGQEWLTPKLFRIGASTLLDNVVKELKSA